MAGNLTAQVRDIAQVTTAVAQGRPVAEDRRRRARRDPRAEEHRQHDGRPALRRSPTRSPGSPARSAPRAGSAARPRCTGVAGVWRDLTDSVNFMAGNLTAQVRNIAQVATAVAQRRPVAEDHRRRARRDPGAQEHPQHDGRPALRPSPTRSPASPARSAPRASLGGQAEVQGVSGTWKDLTESVNFMADNLTAQVRNIAEVTTAVAKGDLSQKITRRRAGRDPGAEGRPSTRWSTSSPPSPTRSPGWPARSAPRATSAARRRCAASPAPGRTSPTTSTSWPPT